MEFFKGVRGFDHKGRAKIGVLLANLGSPDAPTPEALYPYLKKFLSDPRVIELPRVKWQLILNFFILPKRKHTSATIYKKIWTADGSPLVVNALKQRNALAARLDAEYPGTFLVEAGMRIGEPALEGALERLQQSGARRLLVLPLFPQYSGTTNGSIFDGVTEELRKWRWVPDFRMASGYHDEPMYIRALANSVRETWASGGRPARLLLSFHGIPKRYFEGGDPYFCFCQKTGRLLIEELGLKPGEAHIAFQSLFGKEEWLRPYTSEVLEEWAKEGVGEVDVICPGFSADCLETLEEIEVEYKKVFLENGGRRLRYIPALNDRADHIELLAELVRIHTNGWPLRDEAPVEVRLQHPGREV